MSQTSQSGPQDLGFGGQTDKKIRRRPYAWSTCYCAPRWGACSFWLLSHPAEPPLYVVACRPAPTNWRRRRQRSTANFFLFHLDDRGFCRVRESRLGDRLWTGCETPRFFRRFATVPRISHEPRRQRGVPSQADGDRDIPATGKPLMFDFRKNRTGNTLHMGGSRRRMPCILCVIGESPESRKVVGAARFELTTFCTQNRRATRLRYAPTRLP